jgi:ActD protein
MLMFPNLRILKNGKKQSMQDGASRHFVAEFIDPDHLKSAVKAVRKAGYTIEDAYTPFAVHGLEKAMGLKATRLPMVCLFFALFGALAKFWFQIWTSASSWALNVGGKPLASVPAFIPVTFEITVLFAGLGTVGIFLLRSKLFPGKKSSKLSLNITNDRFVLVLLEDSAQFDVSDATELVKSHNAVHVEEFVKEIQA